MSVNSVQAVGSLIVLYNYCDLFDSNINSWLEEFKDVVDKRVLWDLLKYKIRQLTHKLLQNKSSEPDN